MQIIISNYFVHPSQHRMATIMDSDTILVLGDGKVVECDSPQNLLAEEGSVFASLVNGK